MPEEKTALEVEREKFFAHLRAHGVAKETIDSLFGEGIDKFVEGLVEMTSFGEQSLQRAMDMKSTVEVAQSIVQMRLRKDMAYGDLTQSTGVSFFDIPREVVQAISSYALDKYDVYVRRVEGFSVNLRNN